MPLARFCYSAKDLNFDLAQSYESRFDQQVVSSWLKHQDEGHFRYKLDLHNKTLPGKFKYLLQLNPGRGQKVRPPQAMHNLRQPFNPDEFNFGKINLDKEGVFELEFQDSEIQVEGKHVLVINVSPLEFGQTILVPKIDDQLPQILTLDSIRLALQLVLLSGNPDFKASFNSLCAYASINHLHWHFYYLRNEQLTIQTVPVRQVVGPCHVIDEADYPAVAFAFQLKDKSVLGLNNLAENVYKLAHHLTKSNVAHNVVIARGSHFETPHGALDTIRVFVWAREKVLGRKAVGVITMSGMELSGQVACFSQDQFDSTTEEDIAKAQRDNCALVNTEQLLQVKRLFSN